VSLLVGSPAARHGRLSTVSLRVAPASAKIEWKPVPLTPVLLDGWSVSLGFLPIFLLRDRLENNSF